MPNPFRDMSVIMQGLVAAAIAVVLVLVGIYLPFSPVAQEKDQVDKAVACALQPPCLLDPFSPVAQEKDQVDKAVAERTQLNLEVQQLQVYKQRYGELRQQM